MLAIYQWFSNDSGQHYRTALLLTQDDDFPIVEIDDELPRFLVYTIEFGSPKEVDTIGVAGHSSLEDARTEAVEWTGEPRVVDWWALPGSLQLGFFNFVRHPDVVDWYDRQYSERLAD
ncbi:MAG TPA: hypothetical protein VK992_03080 [Candidatus Caenarcaniphilales bacterium]|nr:hypothetical protein [Candidatus Caenarcaniphilales bacterium]